VQYVWPNHPMPARPALTIVPLANRIFVCDAAQFARDCTTFWTPYMNGPSLYNSFVSTAAIRRVTERSGGTFFHSVTPDAYSGDCSLFRARPLSLFKPSIQCEWRIGFEQRGKH